MKSDQEIMQRVRAAIDDCTQGLDETPSLEYRLSRTIWKTDPEGGARARLRPVRALSFAVALALVLALATGAYALFTSWSRGMEKAITATEDEKLHAEESGLVETPSLVAASANDVTVTVLQTAIGSGSSRIVLRFEGIELPAGMRPFLDYSRSHVLFDGVPVSFSAGFVTEDGEHYADENGALELVITADVGASSLITLYIGGVEAEDIYMTEETKMESVILANGPWRLSFKPSSSDESRTISFEAPFDGPGEPPVTAVIDPITVTLQFERNADWPFDSFYWQVVGVELTDGTRLIGINSPSATSSAILTDHDMMNITLSFPLSRMIQPSQVKALILCSEGFYFAGQTPESALVTVPVWDPVVLSDIYR